jgi:hypothetical protein
MKIASKNLIRPLPVQIADDDGFRDLLSRSWMHIDEQDEVALATQRRQKPRCVGGSLLFVVTRFVAVTCIYGEDPPRVTVFHNRLALSLSKHIRHGPIVKINGKRKPRTWEGLGRILMDHSCVRHAPTSITSPLHATLHLTRPDEVRRASACVSPFLLFFILLQVHREQPTI